MIKRFLPEALGLLGVFLLVPLIQGKPDIPRIFPPRVAPKPPPQGIPAKEQRILFDRPDPSDLSLKDRNIFAADGLYLKPGEVRKPPMPENPYTLVGVLDGKERKAVFRDYTGAILVLTKGKKLIDEAIILRITSRSVVLKKDNNERELKLFQISTPKPLRLNNP